MNKILKASAGTGKTYRLSLEYVASLSQGIDYQEIVVMTFTRKATAEIRERIISHLEDIIKNKNESEILISLHKIYPDLKINFNDLQQKYQQMLLNKDQINVYTIDSFINKIFKAAIAPYLGVYNYQIINSEKNKEIIEEVFREMLNDSDNIELLELFMQNNTERDLDKYFALIKYLLANRWKFLLFKHNKRAFKTDDDFIEPFSEMIEILQEIARARDEDFNEDYFIKNYRSIIIDYLGREGKITKEKLIINFYQDFYNKSPWNGHKTRGKKYAAQKEELELTYERFLERLAARVFNLEMIKYEEQIFALIEIIYDIYDRLKFTQKKFTHADLSNYTFQYFKETELSLLDDGDLTPYFHDLLGIKSKVLYIDEFQDTSILQWKILLPLIKECEEFIAVGDSKQSIYGWRGGEKELFANLENMIKAEVEDLTTCYRSQKCILDFVNSFFTNLALEWKYQSVAHLPAKNTGYTRILLGGQNLIINTETKKFAKKSETEKEAILSFNARVKKDLKAEIANIIADEFTNYEQIAILARTNSDLNKIAEELDKRKIPYLQESKHSLLDHPAIQPIYYLLNYLSYGDYFNLLKYLRSDLVGINQSELRFLLTNQQQVKGYLLNSHELNCGQRLKGHLQKLRGLKTFSYQQLKNYIFKETGVMEYNRHNKGASKNLYRFYQLMQNHTNLAEFMNFLAENREQDELKQVSVKGDNAVKLMTVHQAKGLSFQTEFFYWKPGHRKINNTDELQLFLEFDQSYQQVDEYLLTSSKYEKLFPYLDIDYHEKNSEKELQEEINNIYVALTRPADNLYLLVESPCKINFNDDLSWQNNDSYSFYEEALLAATNTVSLKELTVAKEFGQKIVFANEVDTRASDLPELDKYFKDDIINIEGINHEYSPQVNLEQIEKKLIGLAVHYYLEQIKYGNEKEKTLARKLVYARYGNILGSESINLVFNKADKMIKNQAQFFTEKWDVFNEYQLKTDDKIYRIDRLLLDRDEKKLIIIDFKTGSYYEEAQLANYKKIIANKLGEEYKIETYFIEV